MKKNGKEGKGSKWKLSDGSGGNERKVKKRERLIAKEG